MSEHEDDKKTEDEDVQGHRFAKTDERVAEPDKVAEPDVEGHKMASKLEEPDVEGHQFGKVERSES